MIWKLADAKNKLSELVRRALEEGPQHIERRGAPAVVVLSQAEYERLSGRRLPLVEFLATAPDLAELDLERDPSEMRSVDL